MVAPIPPAAPARALRLCADGCGQPITVGSPGRRYVPGHAKTSARPINSADFTAADLKKFTSKIELSDNGMCWAWTGPRDQNGYGKIWFGKRRDARKLSVHRVMWALAHDGLLPAIDEILHKCDVMVGGLGPSCVRPDHLMNGGAAGHALNAQDAASKGLLNRVLAPIQVLELRDAHRAGRSASSLAREVGVNASTVRRAVAGVTWAHLNGDWTPAPARSPFCRNGHPYDGLYVVDGKFRKNTCSICVRGHNQAASAARHRANGTTPQQWNKLKTLCKRGHKFAEGTILGSDGRQHRVCLTCKRAAALASYYRRKAEAA
jgi:hypothetical protein